ncbi:MAG: 8-oxoguanine deaminase [Deltaproteobacteria bacterium]|nr:8-oxoguanine deaminase [Deltaproteobacteria bacterium]
MLIRRALAVAVMDDAQTELRDADVLVEGPAIRAVGRDLEPPPGTRVFDAAGMVVVPGLVNTHHHLYQTLFRNVRDVQDATLFEWLRALYPRWAGIDLEAVRTSALVGLGELLLSGCTTAADHFYLFPHGQPNTILDETVAAAREIGMRFHPTRGSMSVGTSKGGLPPEHVVQTEDEILRDSERFIAAHHDRSRFAMCRVGLAPCSPFSVSAELMRDTATLARRHGCTLHTHLAETLDEENYCLKKFGKRPFEYARDLGWTGPDVWFAHTVHLSDAEVAEMGRTRTGVAHCPSSNLRLGSGIARIPDLVRAGARVGLAVDGSASNDASDLLAELRLCLLVHRVGTGVREMPARLALRLATRGGAEVLCREDTGRLQPGFAADLAVFDLRDIAYAGALHDPLAALAFCVGRRRAELVVVNGEVVVEHGRLLRIDEQRLVHRQNELAARLVP